MSIHAAATCKNAGMDWDDLRFVLAVGRAGTLAAAARRLGVNQTTVARRLASAERALGRRLFERTEGTLRPTRAGLAAIARAATIEGDVAAVTNGHAAEDGPFGTVRLTAVPILVNRILVPAVPALIARHPGLRLELVADRRNASLSRREADIALRLSRPQADAAALVRRIGRLDYAAYAPAGVDATGLPWIGYDEASAHLPQARRLAGATPGAALALNDAEALVHAVAAGLGRTLLPCLAADGAAQLVRCDSAIALSREVWLMTHRDARRQARIEAVIGWCEGLFRPPT